MTNGTAQHITQATSSDTSITVALIPAARSGLDRLHDRTGPSQAGLANCAIGWCAYFDAQLRAEYHLRLWKGEPGKAHTLSLPIGRLAATHSIRWLPVNGEACGAGSGVPAAPGFHFKAARLLPAQASRGCRGMVAGLAAPLARPGLAAALARPGLAAALARPGLAAPLARHWLAVTNSRGSPVAAPGRGGAPTCPAVRHPAIAPLASRGRQKGEPS
jgi:hypothetical protein